MIMKTTKKRVVKLLAITGALSGILNGFAADSGTFPGWSDSIQPVMPAPGLHYYYSVPPIRSLRTLKVDVCIYGGTPAGVAAAIQARRMGKTSALAVFGRHVGGLTSAGLTSVDLGQKGAIGGIMAEFFERVGRWTHFKPGKAERTFRAMLKEADVPVWFEHRLRSVEKKGPRITALVFENGNRIEAEMFVDATYEGDLLARAGVSFHVGRESNAVYGETVNGFQITPHHNFKIPVDPYRLPGDPSSGLLPGILPGPPPAAGSGDRQIQAYCFRMHADTSADRKPFPKPSDFDRDAYLLLLRYLTTAGSDYKWSFSYTNGPLKLNPGDCNSAGPVSIDYLGANWEWPEADYVVRERIFQDHVTYQQGYMWFLANDPEVPAAIRERMAKFGLPADEFPETGGWPHELYVREGRRMISDYVMTEADCLGQRAASDSIGLASYMMDSHNCSRYVVNGKVKAQGDVAKKVKHPYPISYRAIVPKGNECVNLLVPVALSSSHIAFGSIRMEPVFMILGQSAGTAATLAVDGDVSVQQVDYAALRKRLLADGQILDWSATEESR